MIFFGSQPNREILDVPKVVVFFEREDFLNGWDKTLEDFPGFFLKENSEIEIKIHGSFQTSVSKTRTKMTVEILRIIFSGVAIL